jgi:hypothetical protein
LLLRKVAFEGVGEDLVDADLPDSAFAWASDRDGARGAGPRPAARSLSEGVHRITLTVTDSHGMSASTTAEITVQRAGAYLPLLRRRTARDFLACAGLRL